MRQAREEVDLEMEDSVIQNRPLSSGLDVVSPKQPSFISAAILALRPEHTHLCE